MLLYQNKLKLGEQTLDNMTFTKRKATQMTITGTGAPTFGGVTNLNNFDQFVGPDTRGAVTSNGQTR